MTRKLEKPFREMSLDELRFELKVYEKEYNRLLGDGCKDAKEANKRFKELVSLLFASHPKALALHEHLEVMHEVWVREMSELTRKSCV